MKTKIIIADDHLLLADGLEQILNSVPDFEVIAKVANGKLLIQVLNTIMPDLILLDINMPYMNGLDAAKEIGRRMPDIKIVFLSMYFDAKLIASAKENGVKGFILKDIIAPLLKEKLIHVANGGTCFDSPFPQTSTEPVWQQDDFANNLKLSPREIEIIKLIKVGHGNKQISAQLGLSTYTIETHRKNIYRKLNLKGVGELIQFASDHNI
ncbi:Oxygen regulatory protein NreC [compost metagenome]|uniref:response regulator n=1 Tax=Pedobacter sp. ok626 TaxID=1761882 RepID=UPI000880A757|nr:response regulator transcription factor [Pedobacter sp. ok626]SDK57835.1 DNA-binding response regulator, NarL/FixJ family, contains REC and HTH domains [Pedobacter sp. ok626]